MALQFQGDSEHELAHGGNEAGKEGVEGEGTNKDSE